jgi:hypothetical protein
MRDVDAADQHARMPRQAAGRLLRNRLWRVALFSFLGLLLLHLAYSSAYYAWNWDFGGRTEFSDNFEAGTLDTWQQHGGVQLCCSHSAGFIRSERDPGSLALRFSLESDDADVKGSKRAELRLKAAPFGQERWYLISLRIPADWQRTPEPTTVLQWHAVDDKMLGEIARSPPLRLLVQDREWVIISRSDARLLSGLPLLRGPVVGEERVLWRGPLDIGVSTDWLFRIRWSHASDGFVAVWKGSTRIVCYEGPNAYNDLMGPYLKVGIYVPSWKVPANRTIARRALIVEQVRQSAHPLGAQDRFDETASGDNHITVDKGQCD